MTLQQLMEHFFHLYGRRNSIFLSSLGKRRLFLNLAVSDLQHAIRKETDAQLVDVALARIVSRVFCIAEHFWSLPLVQCLARKYPLTHCSYCQQLPCSCPERRPEYQLVTITTPEQLVWSLSEWSRHLNALYGERNRQRGIESEQLRPKGRSLVLLWPTVALVSDVLTDGGFRFHPD